MLQRYASVVLAGCLSGCGLLSPVVVPPVAHFTLNQAASVRAKHPIHAQSILVSQTIAAPGYDTSGMVYVKRPYQLEYFTKSDWVAQPVQMIQPLLTQSLINSQRYHAVLSPPFIGDTQYRLDTQLLMLQQDFTLQPNTVHLVMSAQLIYVTSGKVLATARFVTSVPSLHETAYSGVLATNQALQSMLTKLSQFATDNTPLPSR